MSIYSFVEVGTRIPHVVTLDYRTRKVINERSTVGCMDSDHWRYSDGQTYQWSRAPETVTKESDTPATNLWVYLQPTFNGVTPKFAYLCNKHSGTLKRLRTQGKYGTNLRRVSDYVGSGHADIVEVVRTELDAYDAEQEAARLAREQYIADNRLMRILDAQTSLARYPRFQGEVETDDFGASRVRIASAVLSVPDVRNLIKRLQELCEEAYVKNEAALLDAEVIA